MEETQKLIKNLEGLINLHEEQIIRLMENYELLNLDIFSPESILENYESYGLDKLTIIVESSENCSPADLRLFEKELRLLLPQPPQYAFLTYESLAENFVKNGDLNKPDEIKAMHEKVVFSTKNILRRDLENDADCSSFKC